MAEAVRKLVHVPLAKYDGSVREDRGQAACAPSGLGSDTGTGLRKRYTHLVGLDGRDLLVLLDIVANLLAPLLQGTLADGLGHLGDFDDLVGVGADMLELQGKLSERGVCIAEREFGSGAGRKTKTFIQHSGGISGKRAGVGRGARQRCVFSEVL